MPITYPDGTLLSANGELYAMVAGERQKINDPDLVRELNIEMGIAEVMNTYESDPNGVSGPAVVTLSEEELGDSHRDQSCPKRPQYTPSAKTRC